ncbi:MAG: DinB family protein [Chloroflexi bacterium]|nr:DinB family protein [Chloroflexota bacterium]
MGSIPEIVSDLKYSRGKLLQSIEGLSRRELTELPIYEGWTLKDVLAHVIGWDQRVLKTLPLMLQNRASAVASVEVNDFNRESANAWRDQSWAGVLSEVQATHRRILEIIASLDHVEIDMRRERHGRIITIRSYVIDVMIEHDREHAAEIELWRKNLEQSINPDAIKATLTQNRAAFLATIAGLSEADLLDKSACGNWSAKDVVGHVADWEQLMLDAVRHIHDPSLPPALPASEVTDDWNDIMAAKRAGDSWGKAFDDLTKLHRAVDRFVAGLKMGDWTLRGPYPWPNDQGTLAELLDHIATHYTDHVPDLEQWHNQKVNN